MRPVGVVRPIIRPFRLWKKGWDLGSKHFFAEEMRKKAVKLGTRPNELHTRRMMKVPDGAYIFNMIKLVALDWNGTLLADTRACLAADNAVLKTMGKKPVDLKRYRETMTIPAIEFYVKNGCSRKEILRHSKKLSALFHKTYERETSKIRTRSGTKKLLRWLKKERHKYDYP